MRSGYVGTTIELDGKYATSVRVHLSRTEQLGGRSAEVTIDGVSIPLSPHEVSFEKPTYCEPDGILLRRIPGDEVEVVLRFRVHDGGIVITTEG